MRWYCLSPGGSPVKTRLFSSLALAAVLATGLTGCGLTAPIATLEQYAPSDGIDANVAAVEVRNLMLITGAEGREFNVVFTAVNTTQKSERLGIDFVGANGSAKASAQFEVKPGSNLFGELDGEHSIVSMNGVRPGSMVKAFLQTQGGDVEVNVPVIDGTLKDEGGVYAFPEYRRLVP